LCNDESYDPDDDFDDLEDDELEDENEAEEPDDADDETPDDRIPAWSVEIDYSNGTIQNTKDYDGIPDPVMELFDDFDGYFEEESDEDFDGDE